MINDIALNIALLSIFIIFYTYLLYPLLLAILNAIYRNPVQSDSNQQPDITVIISAYNEEELIEGAVRSVYNSGYPNEKIRILVGSDGSTDNTISILQKLQIEFPTLEYYQFDRIGKNEVLNQLTEIAQTEFVFYQDADIRVLEGTIERVLSILSDENVGIVISSLKIIGNKSTHNTGSGGELMYQKYESMVRVLESNLHSTVNGFGAFNGTKKKYLKRIPNANVCDDMFILFSIINQGKRAIFDTNSIVNEVRKKTLGREMNRRIRLVAGGLSTAWAVAALLNPLKGLPAFFLWSHKVLRWFSPIFFIMILFSTAFIIHDFTRNLLLILQGLFYFAAFIGWLLEKSRKSNFIFNIPLFITTMNIGFLLGIFRFILGNQNSIWDRKGLSNN